MVHVCKILNWNRERTRNFFFHPSSTLKESVKQNLNFQRSWGANRKNCLWEGCGHFLEQHFLISNFQNSFFAMYLINCWTQLIDLSVDFTTMAGYIHR